MSSLFMSAQVARHRLCKATCAWYGARQQYAQKQLHSEYLKQQALLCGSTPGWLGTVCYLQS